MENNFNYFRKFLVWDRIAIVRIFVIAGLICFLLPFATVEYKHQVISLSGFEAIFPGLFADTWLKILPINWILLVTFLLGVITFFTVNKSEEKEVFVLIPLTTIAGIILAAATIRPYYGIEVHCPMTWNVGMCLSLLCFGICFVMEWSNAGRSDDEESKEFANYLDENSTAILFCQKGRYSGGQFPIQNSDVLVIGRESATANLVFDEQDISRRHCELYFKEGSFMIKDDSTYGTFVNGRKIIKGTEVALSDGDKLGVDRNEFLVILF